MRFAFYGRVSTEDQQDPDASKNWQLGRSRALIGKVGEIVTEYFDIGQSRSIPWKRRPKASGLLDVLKNPDRGFEAVVIGEPQRAFYGNQYGLTYPVFAHYGVQLWVPEVGGAIDPESEAHDLIMSVFGGMSKGERNRVKIRVRSAMAAQAQIEGRYLGGRPPYGYRLADASVHPNPAKAADGKRLHRLEPDPVAGPVVQRIYSEYLSGLGVYAIAQRLTDDGVLSPSAHDRARNLHRSGVAWSKGAVRVILGNPRYTGYEVWNKQRKHESLIDVEDVAMGHETLVKWNAKDAWVFSNKIVNIPLVSKDAFDQVQRRLASRGPQSTGRIVRTTHPYALKGLVFCAQCGRRMQGNWVHGKARYRCRFPNEYATANKIDHPLAVYLREDAILDDLDTWLAEVFAPDAVRDALTALEQAQPDSGPEIEQARRAVVDCDRKLARHKTALEAGADPVLVTSWSTQVLKERTVAQAMLDGLQGGGDAQRMSAEEIRSIVDTLGGLLAVLRRADPADKTEVYRQMGLRLEYDHKTRKVLAEILPAPSVGVLVVTEAGLAHYSPA